MKGMGFTGLLSLLLIGLKLGGVINISWLLALTPILAGWALVVVILLLVAVIAAVANS